MSTAPGLYLHLPFCSAICPYCDFAVTIGEPDRRSRFIAALELEIEQVDGDWRGCDSIYLGGGTPSLHEAVGLKRLLDRLRRRFEPVADSRLFFEANPEDASAENLADWRRLGVATLSLGVQSFDDRSLRLLGRRHRRADALAAVERALGAGFRTVSIDLIYGLPGRSPESWTADLETTIELGPDHVSCYQLTFHQGTPFGRARAEGRLAEPPEDARADLFFLTHRRLADAGYDGYEVSNFARRPEHRSRHNQKYWSRAPYLGLGPSAHSYDGHRRRWWNERDAGRWEALVRAGSRPVADEEDLDAESLALESIMLGFRTTAGVDFGRLDRELGLDLVAANRQRVEDWRRRGLVEGTDEIVAPTLHGLAVADLLAASTIITAR